MLILCTLVDLDLVGWPGWFQACVDPLASASSVLELQACTIMPALTLLSLNRFYIGLLPPFPHH